MDLTLPRDNVSHRSHRLQNKKHQFQVWVTSLELFIRQTTEIHQTTHVTAIAFCCPPELEGKILLLKTAHTLVTGFGEIKLVLIWKLCVCWLAFIVLEAAMQATGGKESLLIYLSCEPCELQ